MNNSTESGSTLGSARSRFTCPACGTSYPVASLVEDCIERCTAPEEDQ